MEVWGSGGGWEAGVEISGCVVPWERYTEMTLTDQSLLWLGSGATS